MQRSVVDFPQPDGPSKDRCSFLPTENETFFTTTLLP